MKKYIDVQTNTALFFKLIHDDTIWWPFAEKMHEISLYTRIDCLLHRVLEMESDQIFQLFPVDWSLIVIFIFLK